RSATSRVLASSTPTPPASTLFPYTTLFRSDRELLASWIDRTPELQRELVARLVAILADDVVPAPVTGEAKLAMARALREHYARQDRKSTRLNSSHVKISYAVFCLKKKNRHE